MINTDILGAVILILFSHVVIANAAFAEQTTRIADIPETASRLGEAKRTQQNNDDGLLRLTHPTQATQA